MFCRIRAKTRESSRNRSVEAAIFVEISGILEIGIDKLEFGEVIYMKKSTSRIVGLVMLIIAVAFIVFALNHPEMSFPWNNTITWLLYGLYVLVTVVLFIAPKMKK